MAPTRMGKRYLRDSQVITCFFVRPDQNDANTQLMIHPIQMMANNWVGQVAVHPLQTKANNWAGSFSISRMILRDRSSANPTQE